VGVAGSADPEVAGKQRASSKQLSHTWKVRGRRREQVVCPGKRSEQGGDKI